MTVEKETTQEQEDRNLINEVFSKCDEAWEAAIKAAEHVKRDNAQNVSLRQGDPIIKENLLKIMKVLQERIPEHLREKVLKTLKFDGPMRRNRDNILDKGNMMTHFADKVFGGAKPMIIMGYGELTKEEREELGKAWSPFVSIKGIFTIITRPKKIIPKPDKELEIKDDAKVVIAAVQNFIQDIPDGTNITIYGLSAFPVLDWKCFSKELFYDDNQLVITSYHSPKEKSPKVTVGDLRKEMINKSGDTEFLILLENHIEHGSLRIFSFEYYKERSEVVIYVMSL